MVGPCSLMPSQTIVGRSRSLWGSFLDALIWGDVAYKCGSSLEGVARVGSERRQTHQAEYLGTGMLGTDTLK